MTKEEISQKENYEILDEWKDGGQRMRRVQLLATPENSGDKPIFVEMVVREIGPDIWQKESDSEKFIREA